MFFGWGKIKTGAGRGLSSSGEGVRCGPTVVYIPGVKRFAAGENSGKIHCINIPMMVN